MVDFIFGVSHPGHWHALNIQQNPHHYSSLRHLGSGAVSLLQEKVGAGVYFNPYVEVNKMVKSIAWTVNLITNPIRISNMV